MQFVRTGVILLAIGFISYVLASPAETLINYQHFKLWAVGTLGLTKDAIHIYVGFLAYMASVVFFKQPATSWRALSLGFVLSLFMEVADLRGDYARYGYGDWGGSLHDILNTNCIPVLTAFLFHHVKESHA